MHLSWPIIMGQLSYVIMGLADNLMVGKLGAKHIAAVGICNSIFFTITIIGIGVFTVVSPLVAQYNSKNHKRQCGDLLKNSIFIAIWLGLVLTVVMIWLAGNFYWFKQSDEVTELSVEFLTILAFSTVPMYVFIGAKQISDGLSHTRAGMVISLLAVGVNVLLNYILIYGNWGAPALGVNGAGYATLIARILMAIGLLVYIRYDAVFKEFLPEDWSIRNMKVQWEILKHGLPSGFQYVFEVAAFSGAAVMMGWLSTEALAAHQIAISLASLTYMFATGISAAAGITVGDAVGKKHYKSVFAFGRASLILGIGFEIIFCLVFLVSYKWLPSLYTSDPIVLKIAANLMIIAALFQISDGVQCISLGALRGMLDVKIPTIITLGAYWVIALPAGYLFAFVLNWGADGIWAALLLGLMFSSILLCLRFFNHAKSHL